MSALFYACKNLRLSADGNEISFSLYNRDCSFKAYPSNEIGFKYKVVLKINGKESIVHTGVDYLPTYVWENHKCYQKHRGLLETAILFSSFD